MSLNVKYEMSEPNKDCECKATGWAAFRWPETIAFLQRLGVDMSRPYQRIVVDLDIDELAKIHLEQLGADAEESAKQAADKPVTVEGTNAPH